jgi:hypothetical protein
MCKIRPELVEELQALALKLVLIGTHNLSTTVVLDEDGNAHNDLLGDLMLALGEVLPEGYTFIDETLAMAVSQVGDLDISEDQSLTQALVNVQTVEAPMTRLRRLWEVLHPHCGQQIPDWLKFAELVAKARISMLKSVNEIEVEKLDPLCKVLQRLPALHLWNSPILSDLEAYKTIEALSNSLFMVNGQIVQLLTSMKVQRPKLNFDVSDEVYEELFYLWFNLQQYIEAVRGPRA